VVVCILAGAFLLTDLVRLRGDAARVVDCAQQALTHLGQDDWVLRSHVAWNLAQADWLRGWLAQAERALADVVAELHAVGEGYLAVGAGCDLGQVQRAQGRQGAALRTFQQQLETASEGGQQQPFAGMAHVGLAELLYERGALEAARPAWATDSG
jgi:ATP/maltotriose-dependent transcriptional regulator MalT